MSLLNEVWERYDDSVWENPLDSLSTWKWFKIGQRKREEVKKKIDKLIDYWIVNRSNYLVLKDWWKYNRWQMTNEEILEYIISYHKNLDLSYMIDHILWKNKDSKNKDSL